ncbi:MoxR family ATPase [Candidatus Venteria ishoeyi]|uniref:ATPase family associated with various cellular activities (AAA) n=1 Tax=Candidatus Venteria ishoeyi TaxID=1899563 RepID=A0A1H6F7H3_9GAMM|nr:hypothetical protein [Candidatus Venteria ishoeyi]SEH05004.1 Uncharacterised protein [Candidatus Venteria ishoeyi]
MAILQGQDKQSLEKQNLFPLLGITDEDEEAKAQYQPQRSIVLVDEIDKAPRDFPNDILNEVEELYFHIPELERSIQVNPDYKPILVLTSNSEKHLPPAFLRRCVYFDTQFPDDRMEQIIRKHLGAQLVDEKQTLFSDARIFFMKLRAREAGLDKKPGTAELLDWLWVLHRMEATDELLKAQDSDIIESSFSSLVKNQKDQERLLRQWNAYLQKS